MGLEDKLERSDDKNNIPYRLSSRNSFSSLLRSSSRRFACRSFPFDLQSLSVKVRARQDINTVQFCLASQTKYPSVFSGTRFTLPEWDYLCPPGTPYVKVENVGVTTGNKQPHSMFIFNQPVSRKIGYYLCNVVPLYFLIAAFGLVAFGNDTVDLANRLNALIALLLTSTAFKYIYKEVRSDEE